MTTIYGALGVSPTLRGQPTNQLTLLAGQTWLIPAGTWDVQTGMYSEVQQYDPISTAWRSISSSNNFGFDYVNSDGINYRVANLTGCVVGASVTAAGSGYLSAPTVSDGSSSGATYQAILGPVVNTITITNGGSGYTLPPLVMIQAPGAPGVQATAYATLTSGVVTSITVDNQGANYTFVPVVTIINDPRDTTGAGATATATTTGANTVAAIVVTNHGKIYTTPGTVPTLTITATNGGTGAAATAIVCLTANAYTVTTAGSGYVGNVEFSLLGTGLSATPVYTNPKIQQNLVKTRKASMIATVSGGTLVTSGYSLLDGGIYAGVSATPIVYGAITGTGAAVGVLSATYGSQPETINFYAV